MPCGAFSCLLQQLPTATGGPVPVNHEFVSAIDQKYELLRTGGYKGVQKRAKTAKTGETLVFTFCAIYLIYLKRFKMAILKL